MPCRTKLPKISTMQRRGLTSSRISANGFGTKRDLNFPFEASRTPGSSGDGLIQGCKSGFRSRVFRVTVQHGAVLPVFLRRVVTAAIIWENAPAFLGTAYRIMQRKPMMRLYYGLWGLLLAWSIGSLLFYTGPPALGRAAIGDEILHFGLPLLLAFFVSILGFGFQRPTKKIAKVAPFLTTISVAILEVALYLTVLW